MIMKALLHIFLWIGGICFFDTLALIDLKLVFAIFLRLVHSDIGMLQQGFKIITIIRIKADTDTAVDLIAKL